MNKLLPTAVLGLLALGLAAPQARAGKFFGLCPCSCGHCCGCNLCIKPYNAFSPVFSGCMCLGDNCAPPCGPPAPPPCGGCAMVPGDPGAMAMMPYAYPMPGYGAPMMMPMMAYGGMQPGYMPMYYPGYYMNPYTAPAANMAAYANPTNPGGQ